MALTAHVYGTPLKNALSGANVIDFDTDTIKVALVKEAYSPNIDTDAFWSTPVTNEVANGSGYTTGGITLTSLALAVVGASNLVTWDAADVFWTATGTIEWRYAVAYKSTGTSSTSPLISFVDFESTQKVTSGEFGLVWNANGLVDWEYN